MSRYAELAAASNFSFLRAASHPEELVQTAAALGLEAVQVPVLSLLGEHDEFITRAHAAYIAASIPGAGLRHWCSCVNSGTLPTGWNGQA